MDEPCNCETCREKAKIAAIQKAYKSAESIISEGVDVITGPVKSIATFTGTMAGATAKAVDSTKEVLQERAPAVLETAEVVGQKISGAWDSFSKFVVDNYNKKE